MKNKLFLLYILKCIIIYFIFYPLTYAQDTDTVPEIRPIKLWVFEIHPRFNSSINYDSNIYLSSNPPSASVIFSINPGIGLILPLGKHKFTGGYNFNWLYYSVNPSVNNALHQSWGLGGNLNLARQLFTEFQYASTITTDPQTSELTKRIESTKNLLNLYTSYDAGRRFTFTFTIKETTIKYKEDIYQLLNRTHFNIHPQINYQIFAKTLISGELAFDLIQYTLGAAKNSQDFLLNFGLNINAPKTTSFAKLGLRVRNYFFGNENLITSVVTISAKTQITTKTNIAWGIANSLEESLYGKNKYYYATDIFWEMTSWLAKFFLSSKITHNNSAYPIEEIREDKTVKRNDNTFKLNLSLNYFPRMWWFSGLNIEYKIRSSNIALFSYTDFKLAGEIGTRF